MLRASFVNNPWGSRVLSSPLGEQHANTTFKATLVGTDASSNGGVLAQWRFRIAPRPVFKTTSLWESEGKAQLEKAASQYASQYTVDETYTLAQPNMPRAAIFEDYATCNRSLDLLLESFFNRSRPLHLILSGSR